MIRRVIHHRYFIPGLCIMVCAVVAGVMMATLVFLHTPREVALASTNISSAGNAHWAWNDAIGWMDFYTPGTVEVNGYGITGYASSSLGPVSFAGPSVNGQSATATSSPTIGVEIQQGGSCAEIPSTYASDYTDYSLSNANTTNPNPITYAGADGYTSTGSDGKPVYNTDCAAIWLSGTGPFTQDFQLGVRMQNPKQPGGWGPWGWTPWASDIAAGTNNTDAEGDVGWSPLVGDIVNAGSDPGHSMYQVAVNTRPLPDPGDTITIQGVGLQEFDGNTNSNPPYYCVQPSVPNAPFTPVYTSGAGWSVVGGGKNGMYSGVGDIADCTRLYLGPVTLTKSTNNISSSTYAVVNDGAGDFSGWAWNDAVGWVSFCGGQSTSTCPGTTPYQVTVDSNGNFHGWAWNDAVGWIDFNCANNNTCSTSNYYVSTGWVATGTIGVLESIPYDTGDVQGAQLDSVQWQGTQPSGTSVEFQFAVSNSSSGPWNFTGPDGTPNTYYVPTGPGVTFPLNYNLYSNYRYFRYLVTLIATPVHTPIVNNVIVDWSP